MEQVASLSVRLRLHPSEQDARVELDPLQLEAALINLCANARDAMPEGGEIAITVKPQGDQARVEVRDSGPGFAPEVAPRVFEPFFTTKPGGKGTGLGLTQVYGFMHAFGGSAVVTDAAAAWPRCSSPSRLPRSPRAMRALRQRQPSVRPGSSWWRTKKRSVRPRALTCGSPGWRWKRRGTPDEALRVLRRERFDAVVSDIVMPASMNGAVLAQAIRRSWPSLPVLLVSRYSESAAEARRLGIAVVPKPYELSELERIIRSMAAGHPAPDAICRDLRAALGMPRRAVLRRIVSARDQR